jgi:hypothetical protein
MRLVEQVLEGLESGRHLRNLVAGLWLLGSAIAAFTAVLALVRLGAASAAPYAGAAIGLVVLAAATHRVSRWALALSMLLLGSQLLGVVGSAIELNLGEAAGKAAALRALGIDPTLGIALTLAYSAAASALFGWSVARCVARRHRSPQL